jgi:hypothetical protein
MKWIQLIILFTVVSCGVADSGDVTTIDGIIDSEHRIFVTSSTYSGNLGGVSGADDKCRQVAINAGLVRTYKAIISTSSSDASNRLLISGNIYVVTGADSRTLVANSGTDLWNTDSVNLNTTVNVDENYSVVAVTPWTGTTASGGAGTDLCSDWSSTSGNGDVGLTSSAGSQWVENTFVSCGQSHPLYCISQ